MTAKKQPPPQKVPVLKGQTHIDDVLSPPALETHHTVANEAHAVYSFAARVINLCYDVQGANKLTDITLLKKIAAGLVIEASGIQDIYGGRQRPREEKKK